MKLLLVLVGLMIVSASAEHGSPHICQVDGTDGSVLTICCEGWTGVENGCQKPVCQKECELYGGTCVSPNVCTNCPENRYGSNCETSQCVQERLDHELLSWLERRQIFKPTCLPDGSYTILQCSKVTRMCHCVNRWTGAPYINTYSRGVPDCSEYYIDEKPMFSDKEIIPFHSSEESNEEGTEIPTGPPLPPCTKKHKEWMASSVLSYFTNEPMCVEDGYYISQRCDFFFGYCICVDRNTGEDIEDTMVHRNEIDCSDITVPEPESEEDSVEEFPEEGCVLDEVYYSPEQSFFRDCNLCTCHGYNIIQCSTRECNPDACHFGEMDRVYEQRVDDECHQCECDHGVFVCNLVDCAELSDPVEVEDVTTCSNRPPNTHFYNECNSCYCNEGDGITFCTMLGCLAEPGSCYVDSRNYHNGQQFTRGCDTFRCTNGQAVVVESCSDIVIDLVLTEAKPEVACEFEGEKFFNGESMLLGSKLCNCQYFDWHCKSIN